jgi:hypothetical protein
MRSSTADRRWGLDSTAARPAACRSISPVADLDVAGDERAVMEAVSAAIGRESLSWT